MKKVKDNGNLDDIKSAMEELNTSWNEVASKLYDATKQEENTGEGQTASEPSEKKKKEGEIEDADFEVVD